jgi:hypothetical protein
MSLKANCGVLEVSLVSNLPLVGSYFQVKKMEDYVGPAWFPSELALPSLPGQAKPCQPGRANLARSPQQGKTCQCRTRGKLNEKPNALLALTSSLAR